MTLNLYMRVKVRWYWSVFERMDGEVLAERVKPNACLVDWIAARNSKNTPPKTTRVLLKEYEDEEHTLREGASLEASARRRRCNHRSAKY